MKASNSTTAPSFGDSQISVGNSLASQEVEDEGVHTSGSMETEVQKQHQVTVDDEIYGSKDVTLTTEEAEVQNGVPLDTQLDQSVEEPAVPRTGVSQDTQLDQSVEKTSVPRIGVSQDTQLDQSVEQPSVPSTGVSQNTQLDQSVEEPAVPRTGVSQDTQLDQSVEETSVPRTGVSQGTQLDQSVEETSVPRTGVSQDTQLDQSVEETSVPRTGVPVDRPLNEDEDRQVWQTLQQGELDEAATKIQSNYRGYRMRRSLKREDAVQMPTTSTSTFTASSDVIPEPIRHSGEFHDLIVLPPSPEGNDSDTSMSVPRSIQ
jgi:hypothetical protein